MVELDLNALEKLKKLLPPEVFEASHGELYRSLKPKKRRKITRSTTKKETTSRWQFEGQAPMNMLAFDLGTNIGFAYLKNRNIGKRDEHYTVDAGVRRFPKKEEQTINVRLRDINDWLKVIIVLAEPKLVTYEGAFVHHKHPTGSKLGIKVEGILQRLLGDRVWIDTDCVEASTLKKWATGNGHASKEMMVARANELWTPSKEIKDDNEADALLILARMMEQVKEE